MAELGYESLAARDGELILKLRRTVAPDRVALYKRFRNDVRVQPGEARIPRRLLPEGTQAWLAALHELLPLVVGASRGAAEQSSGQSARPRAGKGDTTGSAPRAAG